MYKCQYCGRECKNIHSLKPHEFKCKLNPNYDPSKIVCNLKNRGWAKRLTKETDIRVKHNSEKVKNYYNSHVNPFKGKKHTTETKQRMSQNAQEKQFEKHLKGSRKVFNYKEFKFMSSFEVEVAKDLDLNNINWIKPKALNYIDLKGKKHRYYPDFYLPDYNVYLDPKNDYLIKNINPKLGYKDVDKIKWIMQQNKVKILILNKNELSWKTIKNLIY